MKTDKTKKEKEHFELQVEVKVLRKIVNHLIESNKLKHIDLKKLQQFEDQARAELQSGF